MSIWAPPLMWSNGAPIEPGDELEVSYPDLHGIPHRGLVYSVPRYAAATLADIEVIHSGKRGGVCIVNWEAFEQGQQVRLRRKPTSAGHAHQILSLAASALNHPYSWHEANCEHFTSWCYSGGVDAKSETLQTGVLVAGVFALAVVAMTGDRD